MRETLSTAILHVADIRRDVSRKGALLPTRPRFSAHVATAFAFVAMVALAVSPRSARAQCAEQLTQNYTGTGAGICPCFAAGEQAGVVLTLPADVYPVEILKVGIAWGSQFGGTGSMVEEAIHIYAGGLPNPGAPIFSLVGPVMTDGVINEFNLEPIPGEIVIASGPFTVALEFYNPNAGNYFAPSILYDGACQSGKNVVYAIPGGWTNACALNVPGDWVMYVKYRSLKVTGQATPARTVFSNPPSSQTSCDTVYVVNTGCDDLIIDGISGCGSAPFSIDTTLTAHTVAPGNSTPILVCVTPTTAGMDSCLVSVASNASNDPLTFRVVVDAVTAANAAAPDGFAIVGVVPNPFNPSTSVRFTLPEALPVTAEVWSVTGARVQTLARGATFTAGEHALRWDGRNTDGERVASGVYLIRVSTPLGKRVARMVLVQ